ncbi:MAG: CAAX prenyl protease-related protein [Bryobacteraceae bacterium]|jgi:CAAX prenyl protease-like protein
MQSVPHARSAPRDATPAYTVPFLVFVALLVLERALDLNPLWAYPLRLAAAMATLAVFSHPLLKFRFALPAASLGVGLLVFAIWVAPDTLFHYRHHWLFENPLTGIAVGSLPHRLQHSAGFLALRIAGSALVVPVVEELFWRGWLMRWLVQRDWQKLPLGTYRAGSFWLVALLFASEHGPYWEVGLAAGVIYNWWLVRTKSLGDCILAHAVTNLALGIYVVAAGQWQYWL